MAKEIWMANRQPDGKEEGRPYPGMDVGDNDVHMGGQVQEGRGSRQDPEGTRKEKDLEDIRRRGVAHHRSKPAARRKRQRRRRIDSEIQEEEDKDDEDEGWKEEKESDEAGMAS